MSGVERNLKLEQQEDQAADTQGKKSDDGQVKHPKMRLSRVIHRQERGLHIFATFPINFERKRTHAGNQASAGPTAGMAANPSIPLARTF